MNENKPAEAASFSAKTTQTKLVPDAGTAVEPTKNVVVTTASTKTSQTKEALLAAVSKKITYFKDFAGKPGHNPFFAIGKLEEIQDELNKKGASAELVTRLEAIKEQPPLLTTPSVPVSNPRPMGNPRPTNLPPVK